MTAGRRLIGGFFGLESPSNDGGFVKYWNIGTDRRFSFVNARSALGWLVCAKNPVKVWLPAYICTTLASAVPAEKLAYYPVDERLQPDTNALAASVRPGDMVLAVDFFGRAPSSDFLHFIDQRPDLCFVEDCAQAIDTGRLSWGHWRLFSPRKLMGVPDGGLLVANGTADSLCPATFASFDIAIFDASLRRFEDEEEVQNGSWHAANQVKEAAMTVSRQRMSRLSWTLLGLLDPLPIVERRKDNYMLLRERLGSLAFLDDGSPHYVPFGFPIRVGAQRRDLVVKALSAAGIFAPVHWSDLPSPASTFSAEHRLARELLTLPCDQRYGRSDMERIAATVLDILA